MASITLYAGTGSTGTIGGYSGTAWTSPGNATTSNNSYASVSLSSSNLTSEPLRATNFSFAIPPFAQVNGIIASFERKASSADVIRDNHVYLINNGSLIGDNKVGSPAYWYTTEGTVNFGSPTDTWGATLTPSMINGSTFGVMIDAQWYSAYSSPATAYVDSMSITVYYDSYACGWGSTKISKIFWGTTEITQVYHGTTRVY